MKKFTLFLMALLAFSFSVKAQQFVSTEPANRNVIIEEFTGRNCGYCPEGHLIANTIMANNPGRAWAINVHAGSYAPTSYPNFITSDSEAIRAGFGATSFPTGVVNRSTASPQSRGAWTNLANTQLGQASECNIAGQYRINENTRTATITVEVYYTGNSTADENYLTVAMLQDSIMGSQSGLSGNPAQVVNGSYCHMHVLRDIINSSPWGEAISPTTQGTLITKTYEYQIPETIGSPNGVEVKLDHVFFLAWVSERFQGTPTRPILTGCELERSIMTDDPIHPVVSSCRQKAVAECSMTKSFSFNVFNAGLDEINTFKYNVSVGDVNQEFEWNGNLESADDVTVEFELEIPAGVHSSALQITEVNGETYDETAHFTAEGLEWFELTADGDVTSLKIYVVQDQYGEQITWDIINSVGEVIAEGGPYEHLVGTGATLPNVHNVTNLPVNDCYMFRIFDSNGNGICCNYGNGYYYIKDAAGNRIIEGEGDFGEEAKHLISITNSNAASVVTADPQILGDHEAMFIGSLNGSASEVGFEYKKLVDPTLYTVEGVLDGKTFTANVDDLELNTMYSLKAYAMVGGSKIYGNEVHFHTWVQGVSELEKSLVVYPNPANDYLIVEGEMTSVEVYNTVGQCLMSKQVNGDTKIDLSGFNNGIYFLRVFNNGEMAIRKFSVNR